ncbi:MAG: hypothetical protein UV60_C0007G0027 [Parcubacteria group bacterium GW2011_GWA2_43_11]|nr:MAG: hypothetical protein UV60_C0007G0027 [Parcubacteria group bacterium GW2011_GWA2_43_11]
MLETKLMPYPKRKAFSLSTQNVILSGLAVIISGVLIAAPSFAPRAEAAEARAVTSPFLYTFNADGILYETGSMSESSSPYFWLNSGGKMLFKNGLGSTIMGALPASDRWATLYKSSSSVDTDQGKYPQNLFRLLTRSKWNNASQEVKFKIDKINTTNTPNRDGYSGILLMSRYLDGNNLYYAGIRMDGEAVIKKKINGTYYTLASKKQVFPGTYNKSTNPNLIPEKTWMRLKSDVRTQSDGSVTITLSLDRGNGKYETILTTKDTKSYGGATLTKDGYVGIRSDYMDLEFDNFRVQS